MTTWRPRRRLAVIVALGLLVSACSDAGDTSLHTPERTTSTPSVAPVAASDIGTLPEPASAWPEAGFDARFSSATDAVGPQTAHVRWHVDLGGNATPGPVIGTDGGILAGTNSGVLSDLDPRTGKARWTFDGHGYFGADLSTSAAVLGDGTILWPGPGNQLFALTATGKLLWRHTFGGQVLSPAVAGAHRVYVADLAGHLTALDVSTSTPQVIWTLDVGGQDYASPSVGPDGTVYTAADKDLVAVRDDGTRGTVRWRLRTDELVEVSNSVAPDGTVVLGSNSHFEYGVSPEGKVLWKLDLKDRPYSSSSTRPDGFTYFGDNSGRVRVVDTRTGTVRHTITPLGDNVEKVWTSVVADAKGNFYWGSTGGQVYGYRADGTQLFHLDVGSSVDSYPALGADGTLYLGTTGGQLYAIGS